LSDIKSNIEGEDLLTEARTVLDTLIPFEREVRTANGAWYLARILPYRTLDNMIDGVVLTFTNISQRVLAEATSNEARELAEAIVNTVRSPLLVLDGALRVISASLSFYQYFHCKAEATVGQPIYQLGNGQWNIPALRELLENVLPNNHQFEDYPVEQVFPEIGHRMLLLNARRIVGKINGQTMIMLAMEEAK
jgi:two-component system CheB/CheR fusion protein